jgi:hypothetical protein
VDDFDSLPRLGLVSGPAVRVQQPSVDESLDDLFGLWATADSRHCCIED